jgi:hypothetical protein
MSLKGIYKTTKAFGFIDLGPEVENRYAIVKLDTDGAGKVDESTKDIVRAHLYTAALKAGAQPIKNANGRIVSVNSCVDISNGGIKAANDIAYVFDKGDTIALTTHYTDAEGNTYETPIEDLTRLTFDQIHWLAENGYLE